MPQEQVGKFTIDYELVTRAEGGDIQFGMDFTLTYANGSPLCQLIFPATAVGNNVPGQWNVDNHAPGNDPSSLIYRGAENGRIVDTPRELSHPDIGQLATKFAIYIVDVDEAVVYVGGVKFGYSINTSDENPQTVFGGFRESRIDGEQKRCILAKCNYIKFR